MVGFMANPLLTDKAMGLGNLDKPNNTWAPPTTSQPVTDGPVSRWDGGIMTVAGTASATIMLLILILASATATWISIDAPAVGDVVKIPMAWVIGGFIIGFIAVITASFKPHLARIAAPIYALAEGVVLGAISRAYSEAYDGIVLQAVGATLGVFVVMLLLYRSRIIKVTDRTRRIVYGAMMGLMAFYFVSFIFGMFGSMPSFINNASPMGIAFSVFVAGLAAFNLALDFDMIEKGVANKLPAHMEWFAALGVVVTLVWLYLEILRLLSKLRDR
ncbi:MAG: hypothetical protein F2579_07180 [Actinobacteria bacterium]|jgi:uncharacterized YccA/Bax inhibitor family protein|nr:hypothetical protein [Actinomycetota bacterium]